MTDLQEVSEEGPSEDLDEFQCYECSDFEAGAGNHLTADYDEQDFEQNEQNLMMIVAEVSAQE